MRKIALVTSNQDQHNGAGEATSNQDQHNRVGEVTSNQDQHNRVGEVTSNQGQHNGAGEVTNNQGQHSETGNVTSNQNQRSGKGYMFTLLFADQVTGAFANLLSLACFSSKIGNIRVVEPFVVGSRLGLNVNASLTNATRFTDLFGIRDGHEFAKKKHFDFVVVSFEDFLKDAPRKLLIADHIGGACGHQNNGRIFAEQINGFELVGSVCLDYDRSGRTPLREIEKQIYYKYSKAELTVMFNYFGGLESGKFNPATVHRLNIALPRECYRGDSSVYSVMKPSPLVTQCADHYIQTMQNKIYVSVMIRLERILPPGTKGIKQIEGAKKCLEHFSQRLSTIKEKYGVNYVFMCLDVGKYGSDIMAKGVGGLRPVYDSFLSQTIGMTLSEYDSTFTNITARDNPGFVSMVQKTITAKGEVLVLVGKESSFQSSAKVLYDQLSKKNHVIRIEKSCK